MQDGESELSEKLRRRTLGFAAVISSHPKDWDETAKWLMRLPYCVPTKRTDWPESLQPSSTREMWMDPDSPSHHPSFLYVDLGQKTFFDGPIVRRLNQAWDAALYRFTSRLTERFYDFGLEDAKRLALLGALAFCRDFDGSCLGLRRGDSLGWPWEVVGSDEDRFEGRAWVWSMRPTLGEAGQDLLRHFDRADEYLVLQYGVKTQLAPTAAPPEQLSWKTRAIAVLIHLQKHEEFPSLRKLGTLVEVEHTTLARDAQFRPIYDKLREEHERERSGHVPPGEKDPETGELLVPVDDDLPED